MCGKSGLGGCVGLAEFPYPLKMPRSTLLVPAALLALGLPLAAQDKVTYADHARAALENKCFSCHNPDKKKGDLDLTSYAAVMAGGGGGAVVVPGDPDGSKLIGTITKQAEPFMPPEGAPMSPAEIEVLKKWVEGGVLDTANSIAKKSNKPKLDLNVAAGTGKPTGPIAKPEHVLLEPVVVTPRTTAVTAMAASPWGPLMAMASPKQILLYDTDTRQLAGVLPYTEGYPRSLKFSQSGSLLVMGGGRGGKIGHAIVWDVKTGKRVAEIGKEFDTVMSADISPDHSKVVIGSPSKKVKVYDLASGEELYTIAKHTEWILATQFSPDGILLGTADRNGNVFVWEADNGGEFYLLGQHKGGACTDIAWRSDSNVLASCSRDGTVIVWEMNEGKQLKTWAAHGGGVESISFTPDGRLVTCGMNGAVTLWDINGNKQADLPNQGDVAVKVIALHDSKTCVVSNWRGDVKMISLDSKAEIASLSSNPAKIDQRVQQAEQRIAELTAKTAPSQQAIAAADVEAKKRNDALAKAKGDAAANEARKNALPGEIKAAEQGIAQAKAARDKAGKDKEALAAQHKAYNERLAALQGVEKQLPPLQAEAGKLVAADQALNGLKGQLEAAKKELAAKADDAALQAKVKDLEAKVGAAAGEQGKYAQAKQKADSLMAQITQQKAQLGQPLPALDTADKVIVDADAKIKAANDLLAAKKAELPKTEQAAKNYPNVVKDLEGKAAEGQKALAAAQAAAKAVADELAIMQRAVPSLKAAKFNVGVLSEKDALAKLESDVQAYTDGVKENEEAKAAALKRIEDSKKVIADATIAIPGLDTAAAKQLGELQPVEKLFNESKSAQDQAAAKVNEQKQIIAAKEAEIAALAKIRDDGTAVAKGAADAVAKEVEKQNKVVADAAQKLAAPAKAVEDRKAVAAKTDAELAQARKDADAAKAAKDQKAAEVPVKEKSLAAVKQEQEVAAADLKTKQQATGQAQGKVAQAKNVVVDAAKSLSAARPTNDAAKIAAAEKAVTDSTSGLVAIEQEAAMIAATVETASKNLEAKKVIVAAAQKALQDAKNAAGEASRAFDKASNKIKDRERALAEAKKNIDATEQKAAPFRKTHQDAVAKLEGAKKALAEKQAIPVALKKDFDAKAAAPSAAIAAAKTALAPLEKTLADATTKAGADQKTLEAKRADVGKAQAAAADAKKRKADAEQTIAAATKEIPDRDKNMAEGRAELAKLQPQLEPLRAKVKQLNDQYLAMLPK